MWYCVAYKGGQNMAKRKKGQGTVRQRVDGRWEARYRYTDIYGNKKTKYFTSQSKQECTNKMNAFIIALESDIKEQYLLPYSITAETPFEEWSRIWMKYYCEGRIRESTYSHYESHFRLYINPRIGNIPLGMLTSSMCQGMLLDIRENGRHKGDKPLSIRTVDPMRVMLCECLQRALDDHIIDVNPATHLKLPTEPKKEMKTLQACDLEKFLEETKRHNCYEFYFLELSTGLRLGEILALTWDDLDPYKRTITVNKQVQRQKGENKIIHPKSEKSVRTIKISQRCVDLLLNLKKITPKESNLMFPSPATGSYLCGANVTKKLHTIQDTLGLEHIRFHDMRHTFATLSIEQGMDVKTVSHMLGHKNAGFTMNTYMHATEQMQTKVAETMSNFLMKHTKSDEPPKIIKLPPRNEGE